MTAGGRCWPAPRAGGTSCWCPPSSFTDHPQIAPESPADLFNGCEIDEILTLRILTMTDAEKREAATDSRVRTLIAIIEAIDHDFEGRAHVAVTIEDDPGRDLGLERFPGHRFFFGRDEVEPISAKAAP